MDEVGLPKMSDEKRNRKRAILTTLLVALGLSAIAWLLVKTTGFVSSTGESPLNIVLNESEIASSPGPIVRIRGCTTMESKVRLLINGVSYGETSTTGPNHAFMFDQVVLSSANSIEAMADAVQGRRAYFAYTSMRWPPPGKEGQTSAATPSPTPAPCLLPTPDSSPSPAPFLAQHTIARKVNVLVGYRSLDLDVFVELPRDDPRASSLLIRKISMPEFIRRVFLDFTIDDSPIDDKFQQMDPEIETTASSILVRVSSNPKYSSFDRNPERDLTIRPAWGGENHNDAVALRIVDYSVRSLHPAPATTTQESRTWTGNQGISEIKIGLDYDAFGSPSRLLKVFRLSPYQIVPFSVTPIVANLLGLLVAVPILWFLSILRDKESSGVGKELVARLRLCSQLLLAVIFSAPAIYSMNNLAEPLNSWLKRLSHGFRYDDDFRLLLLTALLMWFLFFLLDHACRLLRRKELVFWLRMVFGAIRNAWVLTLSILIIIGFTLLFVPPDWAETPRWLAAFIALMICLVLSVSVIEFYRTHDAENGPWLTRWKMAAVFLGLLLLAVALIDPRPSVEFPVVVIKRHKPTLIYLRTFLFSLRDLMPYALLPGLTILLWRRQQSHPSSDPLLFKIAQLLFVGYIVGSTPNIFLIPLPFFLALWVFPRYVIEDPLKCNDIDSVRNDLYGKRKEKLKAVIRPQSTRLEESLEQLERNVLSGAVTSVEYEKLKNQMENDLSRIRNETTLGNNLEVQEVVIGIGIRKTNWENGKWAASRGALLAVPFACLYLWELLQRSTGSSQPYLLLDLVISLTTFLAYWTVCAFFFGYFFAYLRGNSGLRKGLAVSTSIILCLLLVWGLSLTSAYALVLRIGQTFLFFTLLGVWSDYRSFRDSMGSEFSWKQFAQFEYIPSLAAFGSMVLASFSTAVNSVMQDQYQSVVKQLVGMVVQQVPRLPPQ